MIEEDLPELPERPESEHPPDERPYTELFGLPMIMLLVALVAMIKGLVEGSAGFAIVGAVVAGGVLLAIGYAMIVAKREDRPPR